MKITDTPHRTVAVYRSETDPDWLKLEVGHRKQVDDAWQYSVVRLSSAEVDRLGTLFLERAYASTGGGR